MIFLSIKSLVYIALPGNPESRLITKMYAVFSEILNIFGINGPIIFFISSKNPNWIKNGEIVIKGKMLGNILFLNSSLAISIFEETFSRFNKIKKNTSQFILRL